MVKKRYEVGYGRPPKHTQFKPGESGNPSGRPKGTKNLRTDLSEELAEQVTVTEGGQQLLVSKQRALLKSMLAKGLRGDTSAARALINLIIGLEQVDSQERIAEVLSDEDREVMAGFLERQAKSIRGEGGES